jgi:putative colanic acid biosynthesis UDP-glucose lipid carrier transferase
MLGRAGGGSFVMHGTKQHLQDGAGAARAGGGLSGRLDDRRRWSIGYESAETITIVSDIATILFAAVLSGALSQSQIFGLRGESIGTLGVGTIVAALFVLWMNSRRMYDLAGLLDLRRQLTGVCLVWACIFLLLTGAVLAMGLGELFARRANLFFAILGAALLIGHRVLWKELLNKAVRAKHVGRRIVLITDQLRVEPINLAEALQTFGFRLEHRFTLPPLNQGTHAIEEAIAQVVAWVRGSDVEEVVVAADPSHWLEMRGPIDALRVLPLPVSLVPTGPAADIFSRRLRAWGGNVCVELQRSPLGPFECAVKRCMDVIIAVSALVILAPLFLVAIVAIKLDSPGPLLFRQMRCGFNGRQFQIMKFRTMTVMETGTFVQQARAADPRITRVGKWLRRASVDELPQLINVLDGSMSLVGPRPHAIAHDIAFDKMVRNYASRQRVKPGLTGWAQIHGLRGPTPNPESVRSRVEHDLWYIDHWSIWLDLKIVLKTVVEVIRGRNAY